MNDTVKKKKKKISTVIYQYFNLNFIMIWKAILMSDITFCVIITNKQVSVNKF